MNRRNILTGAAMSAVGLALTRRVSHAQQVGRVYRVGALFNWKGNPDPVFDTFRKDLAKLGYVEGSNVVFEARFADDQLERFPGFAAELVAKNVDVIATYGGPATSAARMATTTIPIVFALVADPVAIGVAATLARPAGNLTGVTNDDPEIANRHIGLLKELNPKLARVAILSDSDIPGADASGLAPIERTNVAAARAAGLTPQVLKVRGPTPDLDTAFKSRLHFALSTHAGLCRQNPQGWQTCRHGDRSRVEARVGDQPQDRARTGSDHSSRANARTASLSDAISQDGLNAILHHDGQ